MQDPVCGMTVESHKAEGTEATKDNVRLLQPPLPEKFRADPAQYVAPVHRPTAVHLWRGLCTPALCTPRCAGCRVRALCVAWPWSP
jgi:YHS domain-containing protein